MKNLFAMILFALIVGCPTNKPDPISTQIKNNCEIKQELLARTNGALSLPASGKVVVESHLVTKQDAITWPKFSTDGIEAHLARGCAAVKGRSLASTCDSVYPKSFMKVWTPSESGHIGQGSVGENKPDAECEMWGMNMYWTAASKPKMGEKFILKANGKAVVACAGYETGPGGKDFIAGAQPEVHYYLGTGNESTFSALGRAVDQSLPYGPLECL